MGQGSLAQGKGERVRVVLGDVGQAVTSTAEQHRQTYDLYDRAYRERHGRQA